MTPGFLERVRQVKLAEIKALAGTHRSLAAKLQEPGLAVIAEIKRASPSRGVLREDLDPAEVARSYRDAGARAVSVLTDRTFFGAHPGDLEKARSSMDLPVLRKDFILDPRQVEETARMGADAMLLIVRLLNVDQLRELLQVASDHALETLVEVHDEDEIEQALHAGARIVGINSRDLDTFQVDLSRTLALCSRLPDGIIKVAESGIRDATDLQRVHDAGFDAALCGEALMRSANPGEGLRDLLGGKP